MNRSPFSRPRVAVMTILFSVQIAVADTSYLTLQSPKPGAHALYILTPNVLELFLVNTKQPDPARVGSWDWVDDSGDFIPPDISSVRVVINGQTNGIAGIGFRRRALYAPLDTWNLSIGNSLYLQLSNSVSEGQLVQVINNGTLWPTNIIFAAIADPLRYSPAIHVNQEGYVPSFPKKAAVGYFIGNLGELLIQTNRFFLVNTQSGATVFQGTLTLRPDIGYNYTPTPYQNVYEADFSAFTTPGTYRVVVPGTGASFPFRIDEGVAMAFARTYALGIFEQRSGYDVAMPFTRFTHAADHIAPTLVPTNESSPFAFTWTTIANYAMDLNSDNLPQIAPSLTNPAAQLYPFVNQGPLNVSGGHFEAADYNRVTYNSAQLIHALVFAADSLPGVGALDNLGIPESGDGISDLLQEAKWDADTLLKLQDADGAFYYSVYPQNREYEYDVLPENGDPEVVWPKNTATTAAAVAALAQCASSPRFKQAYPQSCSNYLAKALLGWKFLTNAIALHGLAGSYQKLQHFDDYFTHDDELAWAACELYLATGDPQFQAKLFEWFPDPTNLTTFRWGWWRMFACYGNAIRDYAFAARSGRLQTNQLDAAYLANCITTITNCGNDNLLWSQHTAYGSSLADTTKAYRGGGWYFSPEQAFDIVVAYQFNPNPAYLDAIVRNLNYEGGCNPVNVTYVTGLGWKRQRNIVDQYSANDHHAMPKDGIPISNINVQFYSTWTYGWELGGLSFPSDYSDSSPYPFYDRWCDDWNVSTEASTTDTTRSFVTAAWLAAQTSLTNQPWSWTNATIIAPTATQLSQPVTIQLQLANADVDGAKIIWEAHDQEPAFGGLSYTFTPPHDGAQWVEAEMQWPDGRRAFAVSSVLVSTDAPPVLNNPRRLSGGGFSFDLAGAPLATYVVHASTNLISWQAITTNALSTGGALTITDSQATAFSRRYYRAVKAQ
jgi:hypothetical protein